MIYRLLILLFLIGTAVGLTAFTPTDLLKDASGTIATFAGVVAAAVIPTMILVTTILQPKDEEIRKFKRYRIALRRQLELFGGVLLLAVLLVGLLAVGDMVRWDAPKIYLETLGQQFETMWLLNGPIVFIALLLLSRFPALLNGVLSLYELHADAVEEEMVRRLRERPQVAAGDLPPDPRADFGREVTIPPHRPLSH